MNDSELKFCMIKSVLRNIPLPSLKETKNRRIIVSLTSYGKRLENVDLTIRSILLQSVRPNKIILWLDSSISSNMLPHRLILLKNKGLDIRFNCVDLKGHKKYFYAMQEYPDSLIITVDDDVVYYPDTLKTLIDTSRKYPNAVVARRVNQLTFLNNSIMPYSEWNFNCRQYLKPRMDLLATGVGGVLYPPSCIPDGAFNIDSIIKNAISADDIWLKFHEVSKGIKTVWASNRHTHPFEMPGSQTLALFSTNIDKGINDLVIKKLLKEYDMHATLFEEDAC